jgi:hypothetical protein
VVGFREVTVMRYHTQCTPVNRRDIELYIRVILLNKLCPQGWIFFVTAIDVKINLVGGRVVYMQSGEFNEKANFKKTKLLPNCGGTN